mgnify:CR=1 FL=1
MGVGKESFGGRFVKFAIVGSGFSGAVLAHELSLKGHHIDVFEQRLHIGGNCFSERDEQTGVMLHKYGPHIFHTDDYEVWQYINQFAEFMPYINRVKATAKGQVFSLPINLHTINQFFHKTMNPKQAQNFVEALGDKSITEPKSFEEQALKFLGRDLYEAFFEGYTLKQWGVEPENLPASILKRLPVRFNYDDNYFNHTFQGMPKEGYTPIFEKLLDSTRINVHLETKVQAKDLSKFYDHVFYSGPIDEWFNHKLGKLGYRTLDFEMERYEGDFQGCAVMNYGDKNIPFTRISEHKHFAPWENHSDTVVFKEYSRECGEKDIPYYPIRLVDEKKILNDYIDLAKKQAKVSFIGRLGTYRYLDMDVTIREALNAANIVEECIRRNIVIPPFFLDAE